MAARAVQHLAACIVHMESMLGSDAWVISPIQTTLDVMSAAHSIKSGHMNGDAAVKYFGLNKDVICYTYVEMAETLILIGKSLPDKVTELYDFIKVNFMKS